MQTVSLLFPFLLSMLLSYNLRAFSRLVLILERIFREVSMNFGKYLILRVPRRADRAQCKRERSVTRIPTHENLLTSVPTQNVDSAELTDIKRILNVLLKKKITYEGCIATILTRGLQRWIPNITNLKYVISIEVIVNNYNLLYAKKRIYEFVILRISSCKPTSNKLPPILSAFKSLLPRKCEMINYQEYIEIRTSYKNYI